MANDRMFLHCPCGDEFMLAKNLGTEWFATEPYELGKRLDAWFEEHMFCDPIEEGGSFPAWPTLTYEHDDWPADSFVEEK